MEARFSFIGDTEYPLFALGATAARAVASFAPPSPGRPLLPGGPAAK